VVTSRKLVLGFGCLLVVAAASVTLWSRALSSPDPGGPQLAFAETEFDFGEVNEGDTVVHAFKFTNSGTEDLRLDPIVVTEVHASCSLPNALTVTVPSFTDTDTVIVTPGKGNEVVLTLNTEGFAMDAFDGRFSQKVRIFTNDPRQPRVLLHIKGLVRQVLRREPIEVQMGTVFKARGELPAQLAPVRLTPTAGNVVRITKVESNVPYLKPSVSPAPDGGGFVVTAAIDPSIPDGVFSDVHLTVHTDHPKKPTVVIPVSASVYAERPIVVSPQGVGFGLVKPGEALTSTVRLERTGDPSWKVLKAIGKADGAVLKTTVEKAADGHHLLISVKAPDRPWAAFSGSIEVTTDSKKQPTITVPFAGWTLGDAPLALPENQLRAFVTGPLNHDLLSDPTEVLSKVFGGTQDFRGFGVLAAIARDETAPFQARVRAIDSMEHYTGAAVSETLEAIVKSDLDGAVRDSALTVYYSMVDAKAFPVMLERLEDTSYWLRMTAAAALGEIGDPRAKDALLKATRDPQPEVALAAVDSLEQFLPDVWPKAKQ
jgi:hypothetical protein